MIRRVQYDSDTGAISGFISTTLTGEYISDNLELYCSVDGSETNISELSGAQDLLEAIQWTNVNTKTEELINYGIEYEGVRFWTNQEAQQNYTGLYIKKDSPLVTYPYTIWDGTGSVEITGSNQMDEFCSLVMIHVQTERVTGKTIRESLSGLTSLELVNYVDPRS